MSAERRVVSSGSPWEGPVGYSRAVRVGSMVFVAGTTAALPDGGAVGGDDAHEQAREALRRITDALHRAGARVEDVVRTRIYVTDISRWAEVGRAHGAVFAAVRPTCTAPTTSATWALCRGRAVARRAPARSSARPAHAS